MKTYLLIMSFFLTLQICAQDIVLPISKEFRAATENKTRSLDGKAGENYWLNHSQYNIKVKLDPSSKTLSGQETIVYTNNSPDSLGYITLATYQDMLGKDAQRDWNSPNAQFNDGVVIRSVKVKGKSIDLQNSEQIQKRGTNRLIMLENKLLPKSKIKLEVEWNYTLVDNFNVRGGAYSNGRFFMNYFYPKIAVYDDIDGWDRLSYTGYTEMYSDFSDYHLEISVPDEYKVWATGELKNAKKLLAKKYFERYETAHKSEQTVRIISPDDLNDKNQIKGEGEQTWIFDSEYVPDVVFATGKDVLWDGLSFTRNPETGEKLFLDVAYHPDSKDFYEVAEISKATILDMIENSVRWPFPYPQYTVFNGKGGMEYPMMCNNSSYKDAKKNTTGLAYHEIAHTYFPFYMGTNERKYAWMDEGWARFFPTNYQDEHFGGTYSPRTMETYLASAGSEQELPVITLTYKEKTHTWYRQATYNKPHYAYLALREYLGEETFYKCMKEYISRWNGKHPLPHDFFATFSNISGQNLNWFWKSWFFDQNYPDVAVEVTKNKICITNRGGLFIGLPIEVIYADGTSEKKMLKADVWLKSSQYSIELPKEAKQVSVGGKPLFDIYPEDNVWMKK